MVHATVAEHVYTTQAFPSWIAAVGALFCIVAGVLAAVRAQRGEKAWWPAILLVPAAGVLLLALGLLPPWLAWLHGRNLAVPELMGPLPGRTFPGLVGAEVLAWIVATGSLGIGSLTRAMQGGTLSLERQLPTLCAGATGLLLALVGPAHATALLWQGPLPLLEVEGSMRVHVGRALDLTPVVTGAHDPSTCTVHQAVFEPTEAGEVPHRLEAHCGLVGVERSVAVAAGEDRGHQALPLAPGNRWSWRHVREWHNQMLWFFPDKGRVEGPRLQLEVIGDTANGPLLTWHLRESTEEGEATEHQIYRWDGSLFWLDADGLPTETPFLTVDDPSDDGMAHDPEGEAMVGCSFGLFAGSDCRCLLTPQAEAALPGPSICTPQRTAGDDVRALGSTMLALITVGLVWIDPDQNPRWVLVSSGTGSGE